MRVHEGILQADGRFETRTTAELYGGTFLSGDSSNFVGANRFAILSGGGKIGISPNATGDVTRSSGFNAWDQSGVSTVTFAARDNFDLVFGFNVPTIAAGTTLLIERDGIGTGVVRMNNAALTVNGTLGGSGELVLNSGAGTLNLVGAISPGSSPGELNVTGNMTFADGGAFLLDVDDLGLGEGIGWDLLTVSGSFEFTGSSYFIEVATANPLTVPFGDFAILFLDAGSDIDGFDASAFSFLAPDFGGTFTVLPGSAVSGGDDSQLYLSYVAPIPPAGPVIPEPGSALLLGLGALALAALRKRQD